MCVFEVLPQKAKDLHHDLHFLYHYQNHHQHDDRHLFVRRRFHADFNKPIVIKLQLPDSLLRPLFFMLFLGKLFFDYGWPEGFGNVGPSGLNELAAVVDWLVVHDQDDDCVSTAVVDGATYYV